MNFWRPKLIGIFLGSAASSYVHGMLWAYLATAGTTHWASWASTVATTGLVVSSVSGLATFMAFITDRVEE